MTITRKRAASLGADRHGGVRKNVVLGQDNAVFFNTATYSGNYVPPVGCTQVVVMIVSSSNSTTNNATCTIGGVAATSVQAKTASGGSSPYAVMIAWRGTVAGDGSTPVTVALASHWSTQTSQIIVVYLGPCTVTVEENLLKRQALPAPATRLQCFMATSDASPPSATVTGEAALVSVSGGSSRAFRGVMFATDEESEPTDVEFSTGVNFNRICLVLT